MFKKNVYFFLHWKVKARTGHTEYRENTGEHIFQIKKILFDFLISGETEDFTLKTGVHQESALSPYLFEPVMDEITKGVEKKASGVSCL